MYCFNKKGFKLENGSLHSGTLEFFATVLMNDEEFDISGAGNKIAEHSVNTDFGTGLRHEFLVTGRKGLDVRAVLTMLNNIPCAIVEVILDNKSANDVYFKCGGVRPACDECAHVDGNAADWFTDGYYGLPILLDMAHVGPSQNQYRVDIAHGQQIGLGMEPQPIDMSKMLQDERHTDGHWRLFEEAFFLTHKDGKAGLFMSPVGAARSDVGFDIYVDSNDFRPYIYSDMCYVHLHSGQSRASQEILIDLRPASLVAPAVGRHLASTIGCRTQKGAMVGWCSWYDLEKKITEKSVMATVEACEKLRDNLRLDFIQIDEGFARMRGDWGYNEKFPNGMGEFIRRVNALGSRPGIWLCPVTIDDNAPVHTEHPEWFYPKNISEFGNWLDVTNPAAREFAANTLREKHEEGFIYFKIDFNRVKADGRYSYDDSKTTLETFRDLYAAYRDAVGEDSYLMGNLSPYRGTFGYVDSNRSGTDSCPIWNNTFPCSIRNTLRQCPISYYLNKVIFMCDPDVTYLRPGVHSHWPLFGTAEFHTWHSFVGLFGGNVSTSEPLKDCDDEAIRMLEIMNPPAREGCYPIHIGADISNSRMGFNVRKAYGDFGCWMVYNAKDEAIDMQTMLEPLSEIGEKFHVFSFWDQKYLGIKSSNFTIKALASHDVRLMRFTPRRKGHYPYAYR